MLRDLLVLFLLVTLAPPLTAQSAPSLQAWVHFTDKGIVTREDRARAYELLEASFDPQALQRRRLRRTLPGLFDDRDLPLHSPYLEGVRERGVELRVQSRWLNGVGIVATRDQLQEVEALPFVARITDIHPLPTGSVRPGRVPDDPDLRVGPPPGEPDPLGWSATQIRQLNLHPLHEAGFLGEGIRIGVIDTSFLTSHPAFRSSTHPLDVMAQWDFVDNDPVATPQPGDDPTEHEHGSLILGALAAYAPGELMGSAPGAQYILLRGEDSATEYLLEERWFVAALEFAEAHGADIISSSVVLYEGYDGEDVDGATSVMAQGWNMATANGVIGLQGGGNAGYDDDPDTHHLLPPAGAPQVITVGAVTSTNQPARFTSDGLMVEDTVKPELLALGVGTASISPYLDGAYTTAGGTSMATPVLAGAVACLLEIHPDWTVQQVRTALFRTGDFRRIYGEPDPLFIRGYGIPDITQAAGLPTSFRD